MNSARLVIRRRESLTQRIVNESRSIPPDVIRIEIRESARFDPDDIRKKV